MKNKITLSTLLLFVLLSLIACKEDDTILNPVLNLFPGGAGGGIGHELFLNFDRPNLIGVIEFESIFQDEILFDLNLSGNYTHYTGESFGLKADFLNTNRTAFVSLSPATIVANAFQLREYATGRYYVPSHLEVDNYFGGGYNKVEIDSNQYFNELDDSVSFGGSIRITNISVGQSINRDNDLIVNFVGASSNTIIDFELLRISDKYTLLPDTNSLHTRFGARNIQMHEGSVILPVSYIEAMKTGYYTLEISAYEPKYVTLSNGKQICMLAYSKHRTTIYITD